MQISIRVESEPSGAEVVLWPGRDRETKLGTTSLRTMTRRREETAPLAVRKDRFEPFETQVDLRRDVELEVTLEPHVRIRVESAPSGADVTLFRTPVLRPRSPGDGIPLGKTPVDTSIRKAQEKAYIRVTRSGYDAEEKQADLTRDVAIKVKLRSRIY